MSSKKFKFLQFNFTELVQKKPKIGPSFAAVFLFFFIISFVKHANAYLIQHWPVDFGSVPVRVVKTYGLSFQSDIYAQSQSVQMAIQNGSSDFKIENDGCWLLDSEWCNLLF